jgi:hypothetical protein
MFLPTDLSADGKSTVAEIAQRAQFHSVSYKLPSTLGGTYEARYLFFAVTRSRTRPDCHFYPDNSRTGYVGAKLGSCLASLFPSPACNGRWANAGYKKLGNCDVYRIDHLPEETMISACSVLTIQVKYKFQWWSSRRYTDGVTMPARLCWHS